jgi:ribosome-binding factor A
MRDRSPRRYDRTARVNEVLREIIATELERLADIDDRLGMVTVTGVEADPDFARARVLLSSMSEDCRVALEHDRVRLQGAIARQVRLKRTPLLSFAVDPAVTSGQRIDEIIRGIHEDEDLTDDHD